MGIWKKQQTVAMLGADISFQPALQYFMQVSLALNDRGVLVAMPVTGNGSGDFSNLLLSNAFMELPADITNFRKGEVFAIWPFKQLF
jgi:molybdopterin molybdotransferase